MMKLLLSRKSTRVEDFYLSGARGLRRSPSLGMLAVTTELEKRSPSPQHTPPGEGAPVDRAGSHHRLVSLKGLHRRLPLPGGEGRGEGERVFSLNRSNL